MGFNRIHIHLRSLLWSLFWGRFSSPLFRLLRAFLGSYTSYQSSVLVDASFANTAPCSWKLNVCDSHSSPLISSSLLSAICFTGFLSVALAVISLTLSSFDLNLFSNCSVYCSLKWKFSNVREKTYLKWFNLIVIQLTFPLPFSVNLFSSENICVARICTAEPTHL